MRLREKIRDYLLRGFCKIWYRDYPEIPVGAAARLWGIREQDSETNPICEKEGHDAAYIWNRYKDVGLVRHQITHCKRCGHPTTNSQREG